MDEKQPICFAWNGAVSSRDTAWAMSQENVISSGEHRGVQRRDMRGLAELSHEDLEFVSVLAVDAGGATSRVGDMDELHRGNERDWEEWQVEDFQVFDGREDRVVACSGLLARASTAAPRSSTRSAWRTGYEKGSCGECGPTSTPPSPRSCRVAGVGDVAGERGVRAEGV